MKILRVIFNLLLLIAIGVAIYKGGLILFRHRELTHKENRGVSAFNNQDYEEAIDVFEEILRETPEYEESRRRRLEKHLAQSYHNKAEDTSRPLSESIELYRKAEKYDEDIIEDEMIKRLIGSK